VSKIETIRPSVIALVVKVKIPSPLLHLGRMISMMQAETFRVKPDLNILVELVTTIKTIHPSVAAAVKATTTMQRT